MANDEYVELDIWAIYYRFALAISNTVIFTLVISACCARQAHKGPPFVRRLTYLLGAGSCAGILFSISMIRSRFYQNIYSFIWASLL